jgi:hypothetical protein
VLVGSSSVSFWAAGLDVTTKSVERTAEAIGDDIVQRQHEEMQRAVQLDLPIVVGKPIPRRVPERRWRRRVPRQDTTLV